MIKYFLTYFLEIVLVVLLVSQVILPIFSKRYKFFWLFRGTPPETNISSLEELKKGAERNKAEREDLKEKTQSAEEVLREIKSQTE